MKRQDANTIRRLATGCGCFIMAIVFPLFLYWLWQALQLLGRAVGRSEMVDILGSFV